MGMFSRKESREINELKKTPEEPPSQGALQFLRYGGTYAEWEEPKPSMSKEQIEQTYQNLLEASGIAETAVSATNRW